MKIHASPFVYEFLGNVNLFHSRLHRGRAWIGAIEVEAPEHAEAEEVAAIAYVRPHEIEVERKQNGDALHILILGGTGLTGPHQVRYALSRGHKVTLFNRGRRPKEWPAKVEELTGDREVNDYKSLVGRKFDLCIDNPTSVPHWIRDAAAVLKGNVNHFVFISTLSVYATTDKPGDETAERAKYEGKDAMAEKITDLRKNMALYGPLKALSEDEAHKQFPGMTTVIRPGLIVGPGDETDRFT